LLAGSGEPYSDEELWAVLDLAGLAERVRALPQGLDAQVGDRGSSLSGGERQRLAIARAVLRWPTLLILDEATNALDPASEEKIVRRLQALQPRPAALVIAHRDRPLELCDRVVRVDAGRLA
jgi:ABC-type multidrug transport system fused ATPase/permease subunit